MLLLLVFTASGCQRSFLYSAPSADLSEEELAEISAANVAIMSVYSILNTSGVSFHINAVAVQTPGDRTKCFEALKRINQAIRLIQSATGYETVLRKQRLAEMRFLRGYFYLDLQNRNHRRDEAEELDTLTSAQVWTIVEADFKMGTTVLGSQAEAPTRFDAWAYLCKAYYLQKKWTAVIEAADGALFTLKHNVDDNGALYQKILLWKAEAAIELADFKTGQQLLKQVEQTGRPAGNQDSMALFDCYECAREALTAASEVNKGRF